MVLKLQHVLEMASRRIALRLKFVRRLLCEMRKKRGRGWWLAFDSFQAIDMDSSIFHFIIRRTYIYFHKLGYTHTHIYSRMAGRDKKESRLYSLILCSDKKIP